MFFLQNNLFIFAAYYKSHKMKTIYRTKVSITLIILISIVMAGTILPFALKSLWIPFTTALLFYLFIHYLLFTIEYEITDSQLIVRESKTKWGTIVIDISTIKSIEPTHTIISAPASSFDRLRICHNKYDEIIVSPRQKEEFIRQLQAINPDIVFKGKE